MDEENFIEIKIQGKPNVGQNLQACFEV